MDNDLDKLENNNDSKYSLTKMSTVQVKDRSKLDRVQAQVQAIAQGISQEKKVQDQDQGVVQDQEIAQGLNKDKTQGQDKKAQAQGQVVVQGANQDNSHCQDNIVS